MSLPQCSSPLIQLNQVSLKFNENTALKGITLDINRSEIITVIGPNGAGKSSLVGLVTGLLTPTQGTITRKKKLRVGYMPQKLNIDPQLPLKTQRFLSLCGKPHQVEMVAQRLKIKRLLNTPVQKLSGGEMQRVLLARALLREPELLVLDEPAQGVDVAGQAELYHLLGELRDELQCGVMMVSHDLHIVMAKTDKVLCLNQHICCHGAPESVSQHPEYLQLFGQKAADDIAIYTHQHDHEHTLDGEVVKNTHDPHANCTHNPSQ